MLRSQSLVASAHLSILSWDAARFWYITANSACLNFCIWSSTILFHHCQLSILFKMHDIDSWHVWIELNHVVNHSYLCLGQASIAWLYSFIASSKLFSLKSTFPFSLISRAASRAGSAILCLEKKAFLRKGEKWVVPCGRQAAGAPASWLDLGPVQLWCCTQYTPSTSRTCKSQKSYRFIFPHAWA